MTVKILTGNCREVLRSLSDDSVHCVVTSPPYWGLRDYGVIGQLGMETSLGEHVAVMVEVFREVRRVLRKDGTLWLNYGDSYATSINGRSAEDTKALGNDDRTFRDKPFSTIGPIYDPSGGSKGGGRRGDNKGNDNDVPSGRIVAGGYLKPKDLCGIPWRVAFALQDDGWWLRQDIIWSKPNPMPESVRDRCTKAHEYIFLLAKSERYYFDADAIAEPSLDASVARSQRGRSDEHKWADGGPGDQTIAKVPPSPGRSGNKARKAASERGVPVDDGGRTVGAVAGSVPWEVFTRNKRSVWEITTQPFSEAHFATFPPALIEPCILAGCPKGGTVLDPFGGAGTTGLVADRLQRSAVLIELNHAYADMARRRITDDAPLFVEAAI